MGRQTDDAACRRARDDATTAGLAGAEEFYVYVLVVAFKKPLSRTQFSPTPRFQSLTAMPFD